MDTQFSGQRVQGRAKAQAFAVTALTTKIAVESTM
jgi:hypothetical protein